MIQTVLHAENGFTLIEFVAAVLILMVGLLGLLSGVTLGLQQNLSNKLRKDAIMLADQVIATERVRPFVNVVTNETSHKTKNSLCFVNYSVIETVTPLTITSKSVDVKITWREHSQKKIHSLSTVITNETIN